MTRASMQHEHTALARDAIRCVRATASGCGIAGPAALRLADAADVLIEENEWLRADAERYRWLRDPANANADEWNLFGPYSSPKEVDAAIDAAMKGEK